MKTRIIIIVTTLFNLISVSAQIGKSVSLLVSEDFSNQLPSGAKAYAEAGSASTFSIDQKGTIDTYMGNPGKAITLTAAFTNAKRNAKAGITTGMFVIPENNTSLEKLTLGFDLWTSTLHPVRVFIQSFNKEGKLTGSRTATVIPPVTGAFYRFSIDMDKTQADKGTFDLKAPKIQFVFELNDADGAGPVSRTANHIIRVDNISYTMPAYYVSTKGNDLYDGRTEKTAFATIQKAADVALPGDVVMIMEGTYNNTTKADISDVPDSVVNNTSWRPWWVSKSGANCSISNVASSAAWIVFRGYPGHKANLHNNGGWAVIKIDTSAAYIEIRDLILEGNYAPENVEKAKADGRINEVEGRRYTGSPYFSSNGVMVDGRSTNNPKQYPHHLRFIGNTVHHNGSAGIAVIAAGNVTVANNTVFENCHFTRYGASGISYLNATNFDNTRDYKMFIVGNKSYLNGCLVPWARYRKNAQGTYEEDPLSDGNGIIVDVNIRRDSTKSHQGRTLVSNNLSFGNGGGGIVITTSRAVDIANNTLYYNVQTPDLMKKGWGDIFVGGPKPGSNDIRIVNNVVVNPNNPLIIHTTVKTVVDNNLFFGTNVTKGDISHQNNVNADPLFVMPSLDPDKADFHLQKNSPAIKAGTWNYPFAPISDIEGKLRSKSKEPVAGAYSL